MNVTRPRPSIPRRNRSDSIPEDRVAPTPDLPSDNNNNNNDKTNEICDDESTIQLFMRHSSPLVMTGHSNSNDRVVSPLHDNRNGSPSPLRLNRPRSNPRTRIPNRAASNAEEVELVVERRVLQREQIVNDINNSVVMEGRRITIRPMAGAAVGTDMAGTRIRDTARGGGGGGGPASAAPLRSRKQGPSHRKVRRWNNDNFVNLAAEISNGKSLAAAEALLWGSAHASKHRSLFDPHQHQSKAMAKFREDESLQGVRQQFFDGELPNLFQPVTKVRHSTRQKDPSLWTPEERFHGIEVRLRGIVVKACENSYAASQVVNRLEDYLIFVHTGKSDSKTNEEWLDLLLESPSVTVRGQVNNEKSNGCNVQPQNDETQHHSELSTKFLFDANSSTGGFHRLLLHGVCQFHGLAAVSSTQQVTVKSHKTPQKARILTATGKLTGTEVRLVDFIANRQRMLETTTDDLLEKETCNLASLKV